MFRRSKTVASQHVSNIMRIVGCAGVEPAEFTHRTGVTEEEARDPQARIGRAKYERVLAVLRAMREKPSADRSGMVWLEAGFPLLAAACQNARSARDAIQTFLTYRPLVDESNWIHLREREGAMQLEYVAEGPKRYGAVQAAGNFDLLAQIIRAYAQSPGTRFSARLQGASPAVAGRLAAMLAGPVEADGDHNLLTFSTARLDEPFSHHNPALRRLLQRRLDQDLADLARDTSLALTVERALRRAMGARFRSDAHEVLEWVCAELRVTRWTLRRRLAEEGNSFKELHARVKAQQARRLLEESSLSIGEVSDQLGFTTPNSFARFFRHEVGGSPQRYRREAAADDDASPAIRGRGGIGAGTYAKGSR